MPTRADVNRSLAAVQSVTDLAVRDLWLFYSGLDLSRPERVRDELLRFLPQLVATYGDVVSTAAAEWYEQVRHADLGGRYGAVLGPQVAAGQVQSTVRYAAKDLFADNVGRSMSLLEGAVTRYVQYSAQETVARNARIDPGCVRFGRVPSGPRTCAFCEMLASRGEYDGRYHDHCHCQVVPVWRGVGAHVEGYNLDAMRGRYLEAWGAVKSAGGDPSDVGQLTAAMRRLHPDAYTDGVAHDASLQGVLE